MLTNVPATAVLRVVTNLEVEAAGEQVERLGHFAVEMQRRLEPARRERRLGDDEGVPRCGAVRFCRDRRTGQVDRADALAGLVDGGAHAVSSSGGDGLM